MSAPRPRVLVLEPVAEAGLRRLEELGLEVIGAEELDEEQRRQALGLAQAVIIRSASETRSSRRNDPTRSSSPRVRISQVSTGRSPTLCSESQWTKVAQ